MLKIQCQEKVIRHRKEAWTSVERDLEEETQCTNKSRYKIIGIDLYICYSHSRGYAKNKLIKI
tara:strand:- start:917 stop:1105 length:189 start_codon:yes stop_codon:yes gene_type:complete